MEKGFTVNLLIPSQVPKAHLIGEEDDGQDAAAEGAPIFQHYTSTCNKIWSIIDNVQIHRAITK